MTRQDQRNRLPEDRFLFAYGRYRRVFLQEDGDTEPRRSEPSLDLDELARIAGDRRTATLNRADNHLLRDLARYLAALDFGRRSDPRLEEIWKSLNRSLEDLGHGISGVAMEAHEYGYVPMVVRNGLPLELRELSDGYQALLVIVFDLMVRYPYLFTDLPNPLEGEALIAIDEVDLHLHPRWQRTVVTQLTSMFPKTQFVLTTHSPAVVQGAIDAKMKVVSLHEENGHVVARALGDRLMRNMRGAEIGSVLLDDRLFGVKSRYSPEYSNVEDRISELETLVDAGKATEQDREELFGHLDTLHGLVAKDESRRAEGAFMSQISGVRTALLKDLAAELKKAKP
jgi:predicted ATP-binding protein involved in virulence